MTVAFECPECGGAYAMLGESIEDVGPATCTGWFGVGRPHQPVQMTVFDGDPDWVKEEMKDD